MLSKINSIKTRLFKSENKVYLFFTIFKYTEYIVLALIYLLFANRVSPKEYGYASIGFQTITYSSFFALGINPVLIKWYTLEAKFNLKRFYVQYNIIFNILIAFLVFIVVIVGFERDYKIWVAIVCALKIIQESSVNINRITNRFYFINATYLLFVISFFLLFLFKVQSSYSFFFCWALSLSVSTLFGFFTTIVPFLRKINNVFFKNTLKKKFKLLLTEGAKLGLLSFVTPFISTSSLFLLNIQHTDKTLLGNYQLADNISTAITLGAASIMYIVIPNIMKKIKDDPNFITRAYRMLFKIVIFTIFLLLIMEIPVFYIMKYFFAEYTYLFEFLNFCFSARVLVLFLTVPSAYFMAHSMESQYLKILIVLIIIQVAFVLVITRLTMLSNTQVFYLAAFFPVISLLLSHIILWRKIKVFSNIKLQENDSK